MTGRPRRVAIIAIVRAYRAPTMASLAIAGSQGSSRRRLGGGHDFQAHAHHRRLSRDSCNDATWNTSSWQDKFKPDGTVCARCVLREFASDDRDKKFFSPAPAGASAALVHIYAVGGGHAVRYLDVTTTFLDTPEGRGAKGRATVGAPFGRSAGGHVARGTSRSVSPLC